MKYIIQSKYSQNYLSNVFGETHEEMFAVAEVDLEKIYFYRVKAIAEDIAKKESGEVVEIS